MPCSRLHLQESWCKGVRSGKLLPGTRPQRERRTREHSVMVTRTARSRHSRHPLQPLRPSARARGRPSEVPQGTGRPPRRVWSPGPPSSPRHHRVPRPPEAAQQGLKTASELQLRLLRPVGRALLPYSQAEFPPQPRGQSARHLVQVLHAAPVCVARYASGTVAAVDVEDQDRTMSCNTVKRIA